MVANFGAREMNLVDVLNWIEQSIQQGNVPRIHGNGFLQLDLDGGKKRMHVFDPTLPCRQTRPVPIHDHTQGFTSYVLLGVQRNQMYKLVPGDKYHVYEGHGGGVARAQPGAHVKFALKRRDERTWEAQAETCEIVRARQKYDMHPFIFHESMPLGYTITMIDKWPLEYDQPCLVLSPVEYEPDNSFDRYGYPEIARMCLDRAIRKIITEAP